MASGRRRTTFGKPKENMLRENNVARQRAKWILLECGCDVNTLPPVSNPEKWWHCGGWQKQQAKPL